MLLNASTVMWVIVTALIFFSILFEQLNYSPGSYFLTKVWGAGLGILFFMSLLTWLVAYIEYRNYSIKLSATGLEVRRGLLSTHLSGVSYHRIRDIGTNRSLLERFLGISRVIVNLTGEHEEGTETYPMTIVLPYLSRQIADKIHDELLIRSSKLD